MDKIKKLLLCHVPISACNLRCSYCYITLTQRWDAPHPTFRYSPEVVGKALSQERMGGLCFINMCGAGETLLPKGIVLYICEILAQGHFVETEKQKRKANRNSRLALLPNKVRRSIMELLGPKVTELVHRLIVMVCHK